MAFDYSADYREACDPSVRLIYFKRKSGDLMYTSSVQIYVTDSDRLT